MTKTDIELMTCPHNIGSCIDALCFLGGRGGECCYLSSSLLFSSIRCLFDEASPGYIGALFDTYLNLKINLHFFTDAPGAGIYAASGA